MTSSDGGIGSTTNGNAFASFLLGYPSARTDRVTSLSVSTPLNVFTHYFGGYAQDDWRINSKFTLNYGLRLEHEKGLSEKDNNFTVGFDPAMQSAALHRLGSRRSGRRDAGADSDRRVDVCGRGRQQDIPRQCAGSEVVAAGWRRVRHERSNRPARWIRPVLGAVQLSDPQHVREQLRAGRLQPEHHPHQQPQQSDHIRESVPQWHRAALGQHPRRAHKPRQQHQLRRPEPVGAARAPVLRGPAARSCRATWG